ncbi:MAG: EamA family transporter RarD [Cryobacterium sp.]|nr:EamA family transporter RarD [Cryobacterium sp.]MBX3117078.1 EamA family transporter RarD [Cryobacterium sp.]
MTETGQKQSESPGSTSSGILFALGAYGLWGFLPAYFLVLAPAGAIEIVAWRILFSLVFCAILLTFSRRWIKAAKVVRDKGTFYGLGLAALFIIINWQIYVFATLNEQVNEAALGYFINPIVTVLLGVLVLKERLRPAQWVAVAISAIAVLVLAFNYGVFPWISLSLAFSFGLYGLIKKRVGPKVDAVTGLTIETAWLIPVGIGQLVFVGATTGIVFGNAGPLNTFLLALAGIVTAIPLILFASAARRLPLVYVGLIQFLTPVLQFIFGTFVMHEAMPPERWIGFGLVWLALIVLSGDMIANARSIRRANPLPS